ncbi:MAG: winged helix-turn-helix domain-containing protein [Bacillota bacterium]
MTSRLCPHCGYNLAGEERVVLGRLDLDPRGLARWDGRPVLLTATEHVVFGSLVHAVGAVVSKAAIAERIGYEGDHNTVEVMLSRIRRKLELAGAPREIMCNIRGRGHCIDVELLLRIGGANDNAVRECSLPEIAR